MAEQVEPRLFSRLSCAIKTLVKTIARISGQMWLRSIGNKGISPPPPSDVPENKKYLRKNFFIWWRCKKERKKLKMSKHKTWHYVDLASPHLKHIFEDIKKRNSSSLKWEKNWKVVKKAVIFLGPEIRKRFKNAKKNEWCKQKH